MAKHAKAHVAALGWLILGTACAEPVDCTVEPRRCPRLAAPEPQAAHLPMPTRTQLQVPAPTRGGQRLLQAPLDPGAPGRPPSREPLALDVRALEKLPPPAKAVDNAPLPAGAPTHEELKALVAVVQLPAKARNFEGLKPFITQRLYDALSPLLAKDGDRLWRHLEKYVSAVDTGFKTEVESVEMERAQLHLTLPDGSELRPILLRQNGVWKIDRF